MKIKINDLYDILRKERMLGEEEARRKMFEDEHIQDLYMKIATLEYETD